MKNTGGLVVFIDMKTHVLTKDRNFKILLKEDYDLCNHFGQFLLYTYTKKL